MKLTACVLPVVVAALVACSIPAKPGDGAGTQQTRSGSGGLNAPDQRHKPYLVLISIDGFRWDYPDLYETPAIDRLAARGIRAESLKPVYPTLTFPNHYSIATGLYPANHGIVANDFPDAERADWYQYKQRETVQQGRWYGGEPLWVAAEKNGMVSAAYYWIGTEADVAGIEPTYWHAFDPGISAASRVTKVLEWLSMPIESRPHLITLYFEHVDNSTHHYGIGSDESIGEIRRVDGYLATLMDGIDKLPYGEDIYVILLSDHGQSHYEGDAEILVLDRFLNLDGISIVDGGTYVHLYLEEDDPGRAIEIREAINRVWRHGRAWLPQDAPEEWHVTLDSRFPDVIVQADLHFAVLSSRDKMHKINLGDHGWDPSCKDMHGIFIAAGPRLPHGDTLGVISNLDIYPLIMEILELPLTAPIDGDPDALTRLLKPR